MSMSGAAMFLDNRESTCWRSDESRLLEEESNANALPRPLWVGCVLLSKEGAIRLDGCR